jgi:regulation of enolase protein 1 (concanavalin A-like superfamily)
MIREAVTRGARHASLMATPAGGTFKRRRNTNGGTTSTPVSASTTQPIWLRLERVGSLVTAYTSSDGSQWTVVGREALALPTTVYVGVAVASRSAAIVGATVAGIKAEPTSASLPSGWLSSDIGVTPRAGTALYADDTFLAASSGEGLADAKVVERQGGAGAYAGVMLRDSLSVGAPHLSLLIGDGGLYWIRRGVLGTAPAITKVSAASAPLFLKLERVGALVTAAYSRDGLTWTNVGSEALGFADNLYAGLATTGGTNTAAAAAAFSNVAFEALVANVPPTVSLTSPSTGIQLTRGAAVSITADAADANGAVSRVDFLVNGVKVGADSTAPYTASWNPGLVGIHTLTAVAVDDENASTTSSAVTVTAVALPIPPLPDGSTEPPNTGPWRLEFEASIDHESVSHYVMELRTAITGALVIAQDIGKPDVDASGFCVLDMDALVLALANGPYQVVVRAVADTGSAISLPWYFSR